MLAYGEHAFETAAILKVFTNELLIIDQDAVVGSGFAVLPCKAAIRADFPCYRGFTCAIIAIEEVDKCRLDGNAVECGGVERDTAQSPRSS